MKNILILLLLAAMLTVTACGEGAVTTGGSSAPTQSTAAPGATIPSDSTAAPGATIPSDSTAAPGATIPSDSTAATPGVTVPPVEATVPTYGMPDPSQGSTPPAPGNDAFGFDAVLKGSGTVTFGKIFGLTVTTTNISGRNFEYVGGPKIVGASVYFSMEQGGRTYTIEPEGVLMPRSLHHDIISAGQSIEWDWTFSDFSNAAPGTYDLHFSFQGCEAVMEDFLTVLEP